MRCRFCQYRLLVAGRLFLPLTVSKDMEMTIPNPLFESDIPNLPKPKRGKVRDLYDFGDKLLLIATDRVSAFDVVFPTPIPDKGRILTGMTLFWLDTLKDIVSNHFLSRDLESLPMDAEWKQGLAGRVLLVKKAEVIPFECIVRGYLAGSGWREYKESGKVCGMAIPPGLKLADKLPDPIFTPSTKAEVGHDANVSFQTMADAIGMELAERVRAASLALYRKAAELALAKGIIIADTKFEFGLRNGELLLVDEILTPDSSRFWPLSGWHPGDSPPSFDKQYLRDWLEHEVCWNKRPPAPSLPDAVVAMTRSRYVDAYERLTGRKFH